MHGLRNGEMYYSQFIHQHFLQRSNSRMFIMVWKESTRYIVWMVLKVKGGLLRCIKERTAKSMVPTLWLYYGTRCRGAVPTTAISQDQIYVTPCERNWAVESKFWSIVSLIVVKISPFNISSINPWSPHHWIWTNLHNNQSSQQSYTW